MIYVTHVYQYSPSPSLRRDKTEDGPPYRRKALNVYRFGQLGWVDRGSVHRRRGVFARAGIEVVTRTNEETEFIHPAYLGELLQTCSCPKRGNASSHLDVSQSVVKP
jgi:hypothetical protein